LGLSGQPTNQEIEHALIQYKERAELLRPGYTRLSLPFKGLSSEMVDYVLKALVWVSQNGWALLCQYRCNHRTGEWRHFNRQGKPLGKEERKWLSHYSVFGNSNNSKEPSAPSSDAPDLSTMLQHTLENADSILQHAKSDHKTIAEALKMVDADLVLGQDDDAKLEELRWYVYPKECATILAEGQTIFDGMPSEAVLGAIHPNSQLKSSIVSDAPTNEMIVDDEGSDSSNDKKRKLHSTPDTVDVAPVIPEEAMRVTSTSILFFRDGEHTGEATFGEIEAGVDDGELSEHCQIFDQQAAEWVSFEKLSLDVKKAKSEDVKMETERSVPVETCVTETKPEKKAYRDSSTWGQANVVDAAKMAKSSGQSMPMDVDNNSAPQQQRSVKKNKKFRHIQPPAKIMRLATQAIIQWEMIKEGDRLLLGLSGGKDSLSLLHCLMEFQRKLPIKFEIQVCTIDPLTPSFDPSPMIPYVESLGLKYHYIRDNIVDRANKSGKDGKVVKSLCAFCARMKRGNLYTCARENKCNKLVLAQHLDDCAESFMMSVMHNGFLRTMKAHYEIDAGDLSVIRPLIYCRESLMTDFAKNVKLPVINENCPACFEEPKERAR